MVRFALPMYLLKALLPAQTRLRLRSYSWWARGWFYQGKEVFCPLCEGHFQKFLPFGVERRPQALCPKCHTLERHRLLWLYLQEQVQVETQQLSVLHMAPEPVLQEKLKRLPNLQYRSADLSSPLAMDKVDIQRLPYADASFDLILCSHVLAHVPDEKLALQELSRVLKPKGRLLLQARIFLDLPQTLEEADVATPQQRLKAHGQADRFRKYGLDFSERVSAQGFAVSPVDYAQTRTSQEQQHLGLGQQEIIFVATPSAHVPA
ncbi:hypothetical protein GCM10023183_35080 [Nibribacter koreensis]|uniref:Methyltransferase type 11 domain-containing protein n=2 Tax=Nibribacter koreensis TaxID=1084519 RepID=A0ABP8G0E8_9BACT